MGFGDLVSSQLHDATLHTHTYTTMRTKTTLPAIREIEIKIADLWLSTGAITVTDTGEENTYYVNEFGHLFFCKNREGVSSF